MTCVSDVPREAVVKITTSEGVIIEGKVIANYGASLVVKLESGNAISVTNGNIRHFELVGAESVAAFEIARAKSDEEFQSMLEGVRSEEKRR